MVTGSTCPQPPEGDELPVAPAIVAWKMSPFALPLVPTRGKTVFPKPSVMDAGLNIPRRLLHGVFAAAFDPRVPIMSVPKATKSPRYEITPMLFCTPKAVEEPVL